MSQAWENYRSVRKQHDADDGFSLLELIIAVSVILVMVVVGMISYQALAGNARDAVRIKHAHDIATALMVYSEETGHLIGAGSGCGRVFDNEGSGWFNRGGKHDPGTHPNEMYGKSIMDCMVDEGLLSPGIIDPTGNPSFGAVNKDQRDAHAYMKYNCLGSGPDASKPKTAYVFVKLENVAPEDRMEPDFACEGHNGDPRALNTYNGYGMNYWIRVDAI